MIRINLTTNQYLTCQICEKELHRHNHYRNDRGLKSHIAQTHKDIKIEEYAEKFKTIEWVKCCECGKNYYRELKNTNFKKTCGNKKCKVSHIKKMLLKSIGVTNNAKRIDVKKKLSDANNRAYSQRYDELMAKRKKTTFEHYGVEFYLQTKENRDKCNSEQACKKRMNNIIAHGKMNSSKAEDKLFEKLKNYFKEIYRHYIVFYWPIDFYIRDIDTFIQVDGVFWHGKLHSKEELKEKAKDEKIFKNIYNKTINDKRQNTFFKNRNLNLLRITDIEVNKNELKFEVISGCNRISEVLN